MHAEIARSCLSAKIWLVYMIEHTAGMSKPAVVCCLMGVCCCLLVCAPIPTPSYGQVLSHVTLFSAYTSHDPTLLILAHVALGQFQIEERLFQTHTVCACLLQQHTPLRCLLHQHTYVVTPLPTMYVIIRFSHFKEPKYLAWWYVLKSQF